MMLEKIPAYMAFFYILICVGNALLGATLDIGGSMMALGLLIAQSRIIDIRGAK